MAKIGIVDRCLEYSQDSEMKLEMFKNVDTECITPFDFFFWPVKCIKTKKGADGTKIFRQCQEVYIQ